MAIRQQWARRASVALALTFAACALAPGGRALARPMTLADTLADPAHHAPALVNGCGLVVTEVLDVRHVPDTLGVAAGRAVKSPPDTVAWFRSALSELNARGFVVEFGQARPGAIAATVTLQNAWVSDKLDNISSNVVLRVRAGRDGVQTQERDYRGDVTRVNWLGRNGELQHLVEASFAKAVDAMAIDLSKLCSAP